MKIKNLFLLLIPLFILSCNEDYKIGSDEIVEVYLIESYKVNENENLYFQIDESSIVTEKYPLIRYSEIISYNPEKYELELSKDAAKRIKEMKHSVHGIPFAVKVNNTLIYSGYFWPSISSASCDWVVIDPITSTENTFQIKLGYPVFRDDISIPDKRNDKRLINAFKRDKKLK